MELSFLIDEGCRFLFNVYLPTRNGETTEADILVIGRFGIIVIESKNYSGWIYGNEQNSQWTQTLAGGKTVTKNRFYNPIWQNRAHILAIADYLKSNLPMYSMVVFSERCELKEIHWTTPGVHVIHRNELRRYADAIVDGAPHVLSDADVADIWSRLYPLSQVDSGVKAAHVTDVSRKR